MLKIEKSNGRVNKNILIERAGKLLNARLSESKDKKSPILLALSGGSCLDLLPYVAQENLGDLVTVMVLDERYSADPTINNFVQIEQRGFMATARKKGVKEINTMVKEGETREQLSKRFNAEIQQWLEVNSVGAIIATLGMGLDGHTSGIIPGSENFEQIFSENNNLCVVGYTANNQYPERVTTTFNFLRKITWGVLLVVGEEKRNAVNRLMAERGALTETPARIYREIVGEVHFVSDSI